MAEKRKRTRKTAQGTGRIEVRRDQAPYRAGSEEQVARVRTEIDERVAEGQRTREQIETRITNRFEGREPLPHRDRG